MKTIRQALDYAKNQGINNLDAKVLLKFSSKITDLDILLKPTLELSENDFSSFQKYLDRRKKQEPIAYITGEKEFYSLNFKVNKHTLIPRPDTELLVDNVITYIQKNNIKKPKILDLGTGSGAIIISILANIKESTGIAVDLNPEAIKKAQENAELNNVANRLKFIESSWFENISKNEQFDIIVSNPPYISSKDMQNLDNNVKNFEPHLALEGGILGFEPYIDIINTAPCFLKHNCPLFLEIGFDQSEKIMLLLKKDIWTDIKCKKDLSNNDRLISAKLKTKGLK